MIEIWSIIPTSLAAVQAFRNLAITYTGTVLYQ